MKQPLSIFRFNKKADTTNWINIDDAVMGGKSVGHFHINNEGSGVFSGDVSLENNGGFSSLKYRFNSINTESYSKIILKIKGDSKNYQIRIKDKLSNKHSFISVFTTSTNWQTIEIDLSTMYPSFRGNKLDLPNYNSSTIEEIAFLIANKKAEAFKLEIEELSLL